MAVEVKINGSTLKTFKQIDGEYSIDTFAGEVRLIASQSPNNNSQIKMGDLVEVYLDNIQRFTGYVEKITDSESKDSHDISYRARDKVADLIDSMVPENVKAIDSIFFYRDLVQLCIDGLGLTNDVEVIDETVTVFRNGDKLKAAASGQTVGDFLVENARIVEAFLNTDGKGNVLIRQTSGKHKTTIQSIEGRRDNNVIESSLDVDNSQRFNKYIVYSNGSLTSDSAAITDLNVQGEAVDDEIRTSRVFEKISEKPMVADECEKAAIQEANIRRARSFLYKCTVAGFSANGEMWDPGTAIEVKDDRKGVLGNFLLNKVQWSFSDQGELSKLEITLPDKNKEAASPTSQTKKSSQNSSTYIEQDIASSQVNADLGVSADNVVSTQTKIDKTNQNADDHGLVITLPGE